MERESFEDESVADILNEFFISVKLDREERPDIDHIYMEVCQALTGSGGWPLTVLLGHDKRSFFAGTYFQRETLKSILMQVNKLWENERDKLIHASGKTDAVFKTVGAKPDNIDKDITHTAFFMLRRMFDMNHGGFGNAPKFPTPHLLLFLLSYSIHEGEPVAAEMVDKTLTAMRCGGIYDHIGHGFSRYSTDKKWLVPHFEKMLYDNALLAYTYIQAYSATGKEAYAQVACNTLDYIRRVLESPEGGFYSAEDADSEGIEGLFYVWSYDEINQVLGGDAQEFSALYNITAEGNFDGANIPNLIGKNIPDDKKQWANGCIQKLFDVREKRTHPFLDDKILLSWNGLAIAAFASAGKVLKRGDYIDAAVKAFDFIQNNMQDKDGMPLSRFRDAEAKYTAHAEDYSFYIWGLIELHAATRKISYLTHAIKLTNDFADNFWDGERGGFYFTYKNSHDVIVRSKPVYDGAAPSANSVAAMNMLRLYILTGDTIYEDYAEKIFSAFSAELRESPSSYGFMMNALVYKQSDVTKLVIKAEKMSDTAEILSVVPANAEVVVYTRNECIPSYSEKYLMQNKAATAYLCKGHMCYPPVTTPQELSQLLAD